ncbi:DUF2325 domain-containing protein [Massilia aurea]|uniref:DUF2325 domain-containing protein n=1 Tax=Massilia aurea TaxID=373040 RepID=UPI0034635125
MPILPAPHLALRPNPLLSTATMLFGHGPGDACCAEHPAQVAQPVPVARPRRSTLADLDLHLHCSIIGTCLSTGELRKLVPRFQPLIDRQHASDLDIHHAAVGICCDRSPGWKDINKALDTRHLLVIKRFKAAPDEAALLALWSQAMASGEVPGAYWALMTHPCVTPDARATAFGDVHMLSHLVGAANRADIRRLVALEAEADELRQQNERQQERLREQALRHGAATRRLEDEVRALRVQCRQQADTAELEAQLAQARGELAASASRVALHLARGDEAERKRTASDALVATLQGELARVGAQASAALADALAVERALTAALANDGSGTTLPPLAGQCIAYIGGRPGAVATLVRLVADAGGQLLVHDGGIEERQGTLVSTLARAQTVVFPVDCISHAAMHTIKRSCEQTGARYHPVRSASVASMILLLQRLFPQATMATPPSSRFCLRHG